MEPDTPATKRRYYGNYPHEQREAIINGWIGVSILSIMYLVPSSLAILACVYFLIQTIKISVILQLIVAFLIWRFLVRNITKDITRIRDSRLLPLYDQHIGDTETFLAGKALSRNMKQLDGLADQLGVRALYDFGLEEYRVSGDFNWYDAEEWLATIAPMLCYLRDNPDEFEDHGAIVDDLEKMESSFRLAAEKDIKICMQFTASHSYSGHIQEQLLPFSHF